MARTKKVIDNGNGTGTVVQDTDEIFFVGNVLPVLRVQTGLWSLDRAFSGYKGELGFPITSVELYGPTGSGKSSTAYSLTAIICAALKKQMVLADLEGFNPDTFKDIMYGSGYRGPVYIANGDTPDAVLDDMLSKLEKKDVVAAIVDSVAAISPIGEINSKSGEANMGRRAKLVTTEQRKLVNLLRQENRLAIHINHQLPNLTWVGMSTPGGMGLHYLSAVRIRMKMKKMFADGGSFVIEGRVDKNRWGYKDRIFHAIFLVGKGLDPNMSSIWDCYERKILFQKKVGGKAEKVLRWKESDEPLSTLATYARYSRDGNDEMFEPFKQALSKITPDDTIGDDPDEDNGGENEEA